MRRSTFLVVVSLLVALVTGPVPPAWAHQARADLSRLVVVGDSLSAGFQNGSLLDSQQVHGYAALVASQARAELTLPLIASPGIPNVLVLNPAPPPVLVRAPGASTGRTNPGVQATNLAVPGARVTDALSTRPDAAFDDLTDLVLGLPGVLGGVSLSQVEWAEALRPTTILVWLGANDVLGAAIAGDASLVTPVATFRAAYREVMARLDATGATLVVGNIPDVTVIPFLTPAEAVAEGAGMPLDVIGPALGLAAGDFVTPEAAPLIEAALVAWAQGQTPSPLPPNVVLDAAEVATIRAAVRRFNRIIAEEATRHGAALVDVHEILEDADARGIVVAGQRLTTEFLGGLFSLDGIHPTNTAYGVIANAFIQALDQSFGARIPPISLRDIKRDDPLVPADPDPGHHGWGVHHIHPKMARTLRHLISH